MTAPGIVARRAGFVATPAGLRYYTCYLPPASNPVRGDVVLLPPFAEELNKSRRMIGLTASALAADGWRVYCGDLFGCGDSGGEFGEATWQHWLADLTCFIDTHTQNRPADLWLWALRGGALFVPDLLARFPRANLLLWQPVLAGKQHLQQFLRLRAAANLIGTQRSAPETPRALLARGESVEIAGYVLQPGLAASLEGATFHLPDDYRGTIGWLEVDIDNPPSLSPAVSNWRALEKHNRLRITADAVHGLPFWSTQEISESPQLIARTLEVLSASGTDQRESGRGPAERDSEPDSDRGAFAAVAIDCDERPVSIVVDTAQLAGVLCTPKGPARGIAVLIIVGGPQYRIGSHRQFVSLARYLAGNGFPSLRFDVRGMGDSDGDARNFEHIERDVASALGALHSACNERAEIVVFGLCDAASAALLFAADDPRVCGLVLANPWVRNEATLASTHLKRYYGQRLLDPGFWRKIFSGEFGWRSSFSSFARTLTSAANLRKSPDRSQALSFQTRMATAWRRFQGRVLLLLSGKDLTAQEFLEYSGRDPAWRDLLDLPNVTRVEFGDADHTFSSRADQLTAERRILEWLGNERQP